jgi:NADPH2:quinone reductase
VAAWRIVVRQTGGPEVLEREPFDPGSPGPGEVLVCHHAIGLNFIDTYVRTGLYPASLPTGLGMEAAGIVEAIGRGVTYFEPGDRVGYSASTPGSYATHRMMPADRLLKLPDSLGFEDAAAVLLKGLTATILIEDCARVTQGQTVLVHAAAGGVGSLLVPWLKSIGAIVIAHAGSAEKAEKASAAGAHHSLHCPLEELAEQVRSLTGSDGVDTVLDGVGKASWAASLASLRRRGMLVSYGNASGAVPPFSVLDLSRAGSLYVTRPVLFDYIREPRELAHAGKRLFAKIAAGIVKPDVNQRYPLAEAANAHRALEARKTTGSTVLIP